MKILYIYKWCTFGGVERVLLNRAFAFRRFGINTKIDIYFIHPGVQGKLQDYIFRNNLQDYISVKTDFNVDDYDLVVSIDTEEAFDIIKDRKISLEIHTTYKDHASYINQIDFSRVNTVFVPSDYVASQYSFDGVPVYKLPNFVIDDGFEDKEKFTFPEFGMVPICYLGRVDKHKNPHFVVEAFYRHKSYLYNRIIFCNIGYILDAEYKNIIKQYGLSSRVVLFPNIDFDRVKPLIQLLKERRGIFVSASIDESFGMSIAESIYFGLPILVSDIPSHRELVDGDSRLMFKMQDHDNFVERLDYVINNYSEVESILQKLRTKLEPENFIKVWREIF